MKQKYMLMCRCYYNDFNSAAILELPEFYDSPEDVDIEKLKEFPKYEFILFPVWVLENMI